MTTAILRDVRLDEGRVADPQAFPFGLPAVKALSEGLSTILEALDGAQFVSATHSPLPATRAFLEAPDRYLRQLVA